MAETLTRAAVAADSAAAVPLVYATGPAYFRYVFGLGDEPRALAFLDAAFRARKGPFSYTHTVVALAGTDVCGLALGYSTDQKPGIERSLVPVLLGAYRPWEWPGFLKRGFEAQRLLQGVPRNAFYLTAIAVTPERRGSGVAGVLMETVVRRAEAECAESVMLHVAVGNARARAFYRRCGFRDVAEYRDAALEQATGLEGQAVMIRPLDRRSVP